MLDNLIIPIKQRDKIVDYINSLDRDYLSIIDE